jgi:hypothetical protein
MTFSTHKMWVSRFLARRGGLGLVHPDLSLM